MARPKKKKVIENGKETQRPETQGDVLTEAPVPVAVLPLKMAKPERLMEKPESTYAEHIAESRKALDQPLPHGQKFFESPEGEILIGEADKNHIWSRRMNDGKGGWVNPRR